MRRNAVRLTAGGRPVSWLGANFWSRTGGPLMWRNYDPEVVRGELRVLREHGLSVTRSFFYWPDFMPAPDHIDAEMTARFASFLDLHAEAGMTTVPTFLVGHMSGENWDPAWRGGRDLYSDVWMVAHQAWFAGQMVRRFAAHEAVCGWLVSNEMPIYGGEASAETVAAMRARRADMDIIEVADQGHAPMLEGELVRQIVGFVDKCEHAGQHAPTTNPSH